MTWRVYRLSNENLTFYFDTLNPNYFDILPLSNQAFRTEIIYQKELLSINEAQQRSNDPHLPQIALLNAAVWWEFDFYYIVASVE